MRPVLVVTGGSRGIGAGIARMAAARGFDVAIAHLKNLPAAEEIAGEIRKAGGRPLAVQVDLAKPEDIKRLFEAVDSAFGRLDGLVNNAGIVGDAGKLADADPVMIKHVVDINVTGAMLVAREAVRRMSFRFGGHGGAIVNISSTATLTGAPDTYTWYAASKAAIDSLTVGLAKEVAKEGIRVNAVSPGIIDTDIHRSGGQADRIERIGPQIPMGRIGRVEEVAEAALFLLSEAASYITGANLHVAGGR
ncbi:MAG: glucose 1-dehydrogenase [Bradyrhizobiaceae bacterium]|nr:glucose 1-dehydrogenase [Bradyrhizobiaceae bacterium]